MRRIREDITGQRFNKLTAVRYAGKDARGNSQWYCVCECGGEKYTTLSNLKYNNTRSCGCDKAAIIEKMADARRIEKSSLIHLYRKYNQGAKTRNYVFDITLDEFEQLTSGYCAYCGAEPNREARTNGKQPLYVYNGIDRIDNSIGYVLNNCVPCCGRCNWMKADLSVDDFLTHITKIYERSLG
jgi:hypothetical protein